MKKNIFLMAIVASTLSSCKAQNVKSIDTSCKYYLDSVLNRNIYTEVDEFPKYLNGFKDFNSYIIKNIKIKEQETNQYSFNVLIVIDDKGKVINAGINGKTGNYTIMEQEILNIVKSMPSWNPAKCKGEMVWSKIYIPIKLNYQ